VTLSIPDFSGLKAVVAGDAMLDEHWFGEAGRISPEAPVPVVRARRTEQRAGGAANVAVNLAALGAEVRFFGIVGDDAGGRALERSLREAGVEPSLIKSSTIPTIHKLRVLARNQQLIRLDAEEGLETLATEFNRRFVAESGRPDVVVLSDYAKGTLEHIEELIEHCRSRSCPVVVDPKGTDFSCYRGSTCIKPNFDEFAAVAGRWNDESGLLEKAAALRDELDIEHLLISRGREGMTLVSRGQAAITLAAEAREVFDVTGAGDTVVAMVAAALGLGIPMSDGVALANVAASLVVAKIGVAHVTPVELRSALHRRGYGGRGLVTAAELAAILAEARGRGDRIVMTNGCFDILHAGHVSYLEEARSLGDQLVVAVNDDESVARLKGPARPITPLEDRMAVLSGLAAVDWVVPFGEDTPAELIRQLSPDVLVKGGDWSIDQIAGADWVLGNGGEVRALEFKPGRSTTQLIETIRSRDG
jgi:D-beta-D-heptose 7-phosphate kinase/D-beta-D-heptose 1-phosphate adenosyltransferase